MGKKKQNFFLPKFEKHGPIVVITIYESSIHYKTCQRISLYLLLEICNFLKFIAKVDFEK
jgi:hypothetical protein